MTSQAETPPAFLDLREVEDRIRAAVARVAAAEPDPLDPYRGLYISDAAALRAAGEATAGAAAERLAEVARLLELDRVDAFVLAFCAAPELDARFGRLIAYLHDDVTRRLPTPRLASHLLAGEALSEPDVLARLSSDAPLRRTGAVQLLEADDHVSLADRPLKLDDRLAARLIGARLDASPDRRLVQVPHHDPGRHAAVAALQRLLAGDDDLPILACGPDAPELLAWALRKPVLLLDASRGGGGEPVRAARLHAALDGAELVLELGGASTPEDRERVRAALAAQQGRTLACAERRQALVELDGAAAMVVDLPPPSLDERRSLWAAHTPQGGEVAAKFRLSMRQIEHAARVAELAARARGEVVPERADLERGAREASRTRLGELAILLDGGCTWADLVLPAAEREQLRAISAYLRHRDRVLSDWGYEHATATQGLKVLFAGESGTGKTMAAQVVATDLGLDVFRVDLATVVSKYIGETERNLDRIFDAAEGSNAILFFDEADALFGKRSEVKDAHDRYANIEVSYLLQRMESYPGAVVLATNYRRNIDEAFLRRLDFAIDFRFPDAADRARIWRRLLPPTAPVGPDVDVDALAHRFELSGGAIRNCSVSAAFTAADDGGRIEMRHLVNAVAAEYRKNGRLTLESEFGAVR